MVDRSGAIRFGSELFADGDGRVRSGACPTGCVPLHGVATRVWTPTGGKRRAWREATVVAGAAGAAKFCRDIGTAERTAIARPGGAQVWGAIEEGAFP